MAFQMAILLSIGAYIGQKLDAKLETRQPWFTIVCVLLFLFAAFYLVFKDLVKPKN